MRTVKQQATKICQSCKKPFPLTSKYWHRKKGAKDGFQSRCKACNTKMVVAWQIEHPDQYHAAQARGNNTNADEVREYKEASPCADCGCYYHYSQMQFDHRPDEIKLDGVSNLAVGRGKGMRARLWAEIAKCDLVCANCHALRTWLRSRGLLLGVS